ncbi:hypothetical protein GN956_G19228 [Arapaima gigas]
MSTNQSYGNVCEPLPWYLGEWYRYFLFAVWICDIMMIFVVIHVLNESNKTLERLVEAGWLIRDPETGLLKTPEAIKNPV